MRRLSAVITELTHQSGTQNVAEQQPAKSSMIDGMMVGKPIPVGVTDLSVALGVPLAVSVNIRIRPAMTIAVVPR